MNKLQLAINMAINHCVSQKRDTIILVPKSMKTQAYGAFVMGKSEKRWWYMIGENKLKLQVCALQASGDQHYDTMFIINPHQIECEIALKEAKMIPVAYTGLTVCVEV